MHREDLEDLGHALARWITALPCAPPRWVDINPKTKSIFFSQIHASRRGNSRHVWPTAADDATRNNTLIQYNTISHSIMMSNAANRYKNNPEPLIRNHYCEPFQMNRYMLSFFLISAALTFHGTEAQASCRRRCVTICNLESTNCCRDTGHIWDRHCYGGICHTTFNGYNKYKFNK